jgi:hypothetical protein
LLRRSPPTTVPETAAGPRLNVSRRTLNQLTKNGAGAGLSDARPAPSGGVDRCDVDGAVRLASGVEIAADPLVVRVQTEGAGTGRARPEVGPPGGEVGPGILGLAVIGHLDVDLSHRDLPV